MLSGKTAVPDVSYCSRNATVLGAHLRGADCVRMAIVKEQHVSDGWGRGSLFVLMFSPLQGSSSSNCALACGWRTPAKTLGRLVRPQELKQRGGEKLGSHPMGHHRLGVDGSLG